MIPDLVTGEDADAVSGEDIPEPDGAIGRPCDDIIGVGVETCGSDISEVTRKHPQWLVVVCCPQTVERKHNIDHGYYTNMKCSLCLVIVSMKRYGSLN